MQEKINMVKLNKKCVKIVNSLLTIMDKYLINY